MKTCLECGDNLFGRADKKYCSDNCRSAHNNNINKESHNSMRKINMQLRRNYKILSELNTEARVKTSRERLILKGFDFRYFTQIRKTNTGDTFYFLYDQGYLPLQKDALVLIREDRPDQLV